MSKDQNGKTEASIHKEQYFYWTKELIAEFAHGVAKAYNVSELWSGDLSCEKQMLEEFVKAKKFEKLKEGMVINDTGQTLIVDKQKFEDVVEFLYNYRDVWY